MNYFRISKYNPDFRVNGVFLGKEWTDYSDVGKVFNGKTFTETQYLEVEQNYINCVITLLKMANVHRLDIIGKENMKMTRWKNVFCINIDNMADLIRDILRDKCWCITEGKECYVHFGFDFYMYIGVNLPYDNVKIICNQYNLFCEEMRSPYSSNDDLLYRVLLWRDRVKCNIQKIIYLFQKNT